jgi:hypothetical protein
MEKTMNTADILKPTPTTGILPINCPFKADDVLFKMAGDRKCNFLVLQVAGERRLKLRAYQPTGELSNHTFVIDHNQMDLYRIDVLSTKLRQEYYKLRLLYDKE